MGDEEISFFAKYKNWIVVKKKTINEKTEEKEIVAILASVNDTASRKAYDFAHVNKPLIDAIITELANGKRKNISNLAEIFGSLKQNELKEKLLSACEDPLFILSQRRIS